jgi:hypothetical protein
MIVCRYGVYVFLSWNRSWIRVRGIGMRRTPSTFYLFSVSYTVMSDGWLLSVGRPWFGLVDWVGGWTVFRSHGWFIVIGACSGLSLYTLWSRSGFFEFHYLSFMVWYPFLMEIWVWEIPVGNTLLRVYTIYKNSVGWNVGMGANIIVFLCSALLIYH